MQYRIAVICNNRLELLIQNLDEEQMEKEYIKLCNRWYVEDALEKFKSNWDDGDELDMYDSYIDSKEYLDANDNANVMWEAYRIDY
jgi:hypothetical protein